MSTTAEKAAPNSWTRFADCYLEAAGFSMDWSQMKLPTGFLEQMTPAAGAALKAMEALEGGAIANPDENRMVGHYWLRAADRAPGQLQSVITETRKSISAFVEKIHSQGNFDHLLSIGIGGSALGPQFLIDALAPNQPPLKTHFFDNTDPDGMARILDSLGDQLQRTLVVVISKSGGTPETLNGMLRAQASYADKGLDFAKNAVAITGAGSKLDKLAESEGWLARFPMWDWVGGRTSVTSAVGLVPLALAGVDVDALLEGAAEMDALTRRPQVRQNPGVLLALCWYYAGHGRGDKAMVVLPYRDRMALFAKYLQQLVMESLGKELDRRGRVVHQGIAVYGNKGSTDQHAYVQQLREGVNDFFATFVVALEDGADAGFEVEPGITPGDFLRGFFQGTRQALAEQDRLSLTLTVPRVDARVLGQLIALYERAVGLYAELVDINAYHQPGVEAGKKAAADILKLQSAAVEHLKSSGQSLGAAELATALGQPEKAADLFTICRHLAANGRLQEAGQGLERKFSA